MNCNRAHHTIVLAEPQYQELHHLRNQQFQVDKNHKYSGVDLVASPSDIPPNTTRFVRGRRHKACRIQSLDE
ncbi:uncharacterized protein PHALS_13421 [Plasmopara halstedii]|uniref:Uncharacterized protein n=1 Tax=Plasmopara halstedii TaxID=4781 RepID=A0A0P1AQ38_PLAHL|nr:uncharacterized protein PHALS_13421 [Plasmopara halstedii]CEG43208.1 hypothetical protein PHALS_13421 [Plasmopara halstedii]|eukprot:XP_024579577.1 hypothetical protein PHALS_13421 [Plasmopara halstedii]